MEMGGFAQLSQTIPNSGASAVNVQLSFIQPTYRGTNVPFVLGEGTSASFSIAANSTKSISIRFLPMEVKEYSGSLNVIANGSTLMTFQLRGRGTPSTTGVTSNDCLAGPWIVGNNSELPFFRAKEETGLCHEQWRRCTNGTLAGSYAATSCIEPMSSFAPNCGNTKVKFTVTPGIDTPRGIFPLFSSGIINNYLSAPLQSIQVSFVAEKCVPIQPGLLFQVDP